MPAETISIHAPLVGLDGGAHLVGVEAAGFQSTRPLWGATTPHAQRGTTGAISIHAPLVGRDCCDWTLPNHRCNFNPRAPCGARRANHHPSAYIRLDFNPRARQNQVATVEPFQSTRPLWGATPERGNTIGQNAFQSTRPLWGATLPEYAESGLHRDFNPRAPCGARPPPLYKIEDDGSFQSTRPLWGATGQRSAFRR